MALFLSSQDNSFYDSDNISLVCHWLVDIFVKLFIASLLLESLVHLALMKLANRMIRVPDNVVVKLIITSTYLVRYFSCNIYATLRSIII